MNLAKIDEGGGGERLPAMDEHPIQAVGLRGGGEGWNGEQRGLASQVCSQVKTSKSSL